MDYAKEYDRMVERSNKQQEQMAKQAAVIEKLREALKVVGMNCIDDFIAAGALQLAYTPTDSRQILAEWLDKQLGEPFAYEWVEVGKGLRISHNEPPEYEVYQINQLFKKPEIK